MANNQNQKNRDDQTTNNQANTSQRTQQDNTAQRTQQDNTAQRGHTQKDKNVDSQEQGKKAPGRQDDSNSSC